MEGQIVKQILSGIYKDGYVFEPDDSPVKEVENMPGGLYKLYAQDSMFGIKAIYFPIKRKEKYVNLTSGLVTDIMDKATKFFSDPVREKYKELGIGHKTGIILYGIPGTGKTVSSMIIIQMLVEKYNAICITFDYQMRGDKWMYAVNEVAKTGKPVIVFCDECEQIFKEQEINWLTFLDGYQSISNFMFIGCTNYIHKISDRLKRPSRIEHLIEVKSIEEEVAEAYVNEKVPKLPANTRAAFVHYAMSTTTTIDAFKNAVKEFYIYHDPNENPAIFEKILKGYIREDLKGVKRDVEESLS